MKTSNFQKANTKPAPSRSPLNERIFWDLGIWAFFGVWFLLFGVSPSILSTN